MRRIMRRGSLQVHTDQYGSCTNSGFTFLGSLSPQHPINMHLELVETRHRASGRPGCAQISIDCRIRRSMQRGSLQVHTSQFGSCTNSGFTFVGSVVPWFLLLCKLHLWKRGTGHEEAPKCLLLGDGKILRNKQNKIGIPNFKEGSLISYEIGDPRVPKILRNWGSRSLTSYENGDSGSPFWGVPIFI